MYIPALAFAGTSGTQLPHQALKPYLTEFKDVRNVLVIIREIINQDNESINAHTHRNMHLVTTRNEFLQCPHLLIYPISASLHFIT